MNQQANIPEMQRELKADIINAVSKVMRIRLQMYRAYTEMIEEYADSDELGYQQDLYDLRQARRGSVTSFNDMLRSYTNSLRMFALDRA